jgi:hypothetical protein
MVLAVLEGPGNRAGNTSLVAPLVNGIAVFPLGNIETPGEFPVVPDDLIILVLDGDGARNAFKEDAILPPLPDQLEDQDEDNRPDSQKD